MVFLKGAFCLLISLLANACLCYQNIDIKSCHFSDDAASCKFIPSCSRHTTNRPTNKIIFEKSVNKIHEYSLGNCSFFLGNLLELQFNGVEEISSFAFANTQIGPKFIFKIFLDGQGADNLIIKNAAFYNLQLMINAQINVDIRNYKRVTIEDTLIENVKKEENSVISITISGCGEVVLTKSAEIHKLARIHMDKIRKNVTYTLDIAKADKVSIENSTFSDISIFPFSQYSFILREIQYAELADHIFESTRLAYSAKLNLLLEKIASISIGKNLINKLHQLETSEVTVLMQDIGETDSASPATFCIQENFLANVHQSESAIIQINFVKFSYAIRVSRNAFSNIDMNGNSKIQVLLAGLAQNIVFDEKSVNNIELSGGNFEIWLQEHGLKDYNGDKRQQDAVVLFEDYAIWKVYQTQKSYFRISFTNSESLLILRPYSIYEFHRSVFDKDVQLAKNDDSFRTSVVLDVRNSEKFQIELTADNKVPELIEIDTFQPFLFPLKLDQTVSSTSISSRDKGVTNFAEIQREFCHFYKLGDYLSHSQNFAYFSETISNAESSCTSCLFLFLYRNSHKRADFHFAKQHLPECFKNIFYQNLNFQADDSEQLRQSELQKTDKILNKYWQMQKCELLTGMHAITDNLNTEIMEEKLCGKYNTAYNAVKTLLANSKQCSSNSGYIKRMNLVDEQNEGKISSSRYSMFLIIVIFACLALVVVNLVYKKVKNRPLIRININKGFRKLDGQSKLNKNDDNDDNDSYCNYHEFIDEIASCSPDANLNAEKESVAITEKPDEHNAVRTEKQRNKNKSNKMVNYKSIAQTIKALNKSSCKYEKLEKSKNLKDVATYTVKFTNEKTPKSTNVIFDIRNGTRSLETANETASGNSENPMRLKLNPFDDVKPEDV